MSRDWENLGRGVRRARELRGITQLQLADATNQETSTIQNLESARYGKGFTRMPPSVGRVAAHFQWAAGTVDALLNGEQPDLGPAATSEENTGDRSVSRGNLPLRIVEELNDSGQLLDATVLDLTPDGSDTRMIVVVKGDTDATPEEIREGLLAWKRAQGRLRQMPDDPPDDSSIANGA